MQAVFGGGDVDTSDAALEKYFSDVDTDGSGKISDLEMKAAIYQMYGKGMEDKYVSQMMAQADTNKDGEVDLAEFKAIMRAAPEGAKKK